MIAGMSIMKIVSILLLMTMFFIIVAGITKPNLVLRLLGEEWGMNVLIVISFTRLVYQKIINVGLVIFLMFLQTRAFVKDSIILLKRGERKRVLNNFGFLIYLIKRSELWEYKSQLMPDLGGKDIDNRMRKIMGYISCTLGLVLVANVRLLLGYRWDKLTIGSKYIYLGLGFVVMVLIIFKIMCEVYGLYSIINRWLRNGRRGLELGKIRGIILRVGLVLTGLIATWGALKSGSEELLREGEKIVELSGIGLLRRSKVVKVNKKMQK